MRILSLIVAFTLFLMPHHAMAAKAKVVAEPSVLNYHLLEPLSSFPSKFGGPWAPGNLEMTLTVANKNNKALISFENTLTDSNQTLKIKPVSATRDEFNNLLFEFDDNCGGHGKGTLTLSPDTKWATIDIEKVSGDERETDLQYGMYSLSLVNEPAVPAKKPAKKGKAAPKAAN